MADLWDITAEGTARELYVIEADSEEEARALWERGGYQPWLSEVEGVSLTSIARQEP